MFSASIGGAAGGLLCFPFESLKKRKESGQLVVGYKYPLSDFRRTGSPLHPAELMRGCTSFMTSVGCATVGAMLTHKTLTDSGLAKYLGPDGTAMAAGMIGAVVGSTPVENTILTQQLNRENPLQAWRRMTSTRWLRPWVGVCELMMREAGFTYVMLRGSTATESSVLAATGSHVLAYAAALGVGVVGATLTHPFDVLATYRQHRHGTVGSLHNTL
jgi:hypothetical protein